MENPSQEMKFYSKTNGECEKVVLKHGVMSMDTIYKISCTMHAGDNSDFGTKFG